nr:DUF6660 family protein [uncultured Chryseobacterium sp.]
MKLFGLLLSLFLVFLITMPCSDSGSDVSSSETKVTSHNQKEDSKHNDLCSPFCICACCGIHTTAPVYPAFQLSCSPSQYNDRINDLHSSVELDFIYGIWQPPKI